MAPFGAFEAGMRFFDPIALRIFSFLLDLLSALPDDIACLATRRARVKVRIHFVRIPVPTHQNTDFPGKVLLTAVDCIGALA